MPNLYQNNPALVNGNFAKIAMGNDDKIYAFTRQSGANRVLVAVNLSERAQMATLENVIIASDYHDGFGKSDVRLSGTPSMSLAPWAYRMSLSRAS